jgi:hypothetical protein
MGASYQVRGSIAVITLDNPPVNGLGYDTRREFAAGVDRATVRPGHQRHRGHRRGPGFLRRSRHQGVRQPQGHCRAQPAEPDQDARGLPQARGGGHQRRLHGWRPRTEPGLPLPRGRFGRGRGLARGQDRSHPGGRRHAASAACAGCGDGPQHHRQRGPREERTAGQRAGAEVVRRRSPAAMSSKPPACWHWRRPPSTGPAHRCHACGT